MGAGVGLVPVDGVVPQDAVEIGQVLGSFVISAGAQERVADWYAVPFAADSILAPQGLCIKDAPGRW